LFHFLFSAFHIRGPLTQWPALAGPAAGTGSRRPSAVVPSGRQASSGLLFHNFDETTRFRARFLFPSTFYTKISRSFSAFAHCLRTLFRPSRPARRLHFSTAMLY